MLDSFWIQVSKRFLGWLWLAQIAQQLHSTLGFVLQVNCFGSHCTPHRSLSSVRTSTWVAPVAPLPTYRNAVAPDGHKRAVSGGVLTGTAFGILYICSLDSWR